MENLNNGTPVEFDEIKDFSKAASDFAENNKSLENLLLNCFSKGIKTLACCGGHKENDDEKPYIAFIYSEENEQYIYAIMSKLKESNLIFRYSKSSIGKTFFSIEEIGEDYNFLFNEINEAISSFDKNKDYFKELPLDLKVYGLIMKSIEKDQVFNLEEYKLYFQLLYTKGLDSYDYVMFSNIDYYITCATKSNFKLEEQCFPPYYVLKSKDREDLVENLVNLSSIINLYISPNQKEEDTIKKTL